MTTQSDNGQRLIGAARAAIGLAQGGILYWLSEAFEQHSWPYGVPWLLHGLTLMVLLAPFALLGGLGALSRRTLAIWAIASAVLLFALGAYDGWRGVGLDREALQMPLILAAAVAMFIAHHLICGGDAEQRWIASYPLYFDIAWRHAIQLALSALFVGVFWIILQLGAQLFQIIGIDWVRDTIAKRWFFIPATTTMIALAIHITDANSGMVRGARTLLLTLLSWLLPLAAALAIAFLAALIATGLAPLWAAPSAASLLLSAAAGALILINAAYKSGDEADEPGLVLRWATRAAIAALAAFIALAVYALWQRIAQYGLTPPRIWAAAAALIAGAYTIGYVIAAVTPGPWMKRLQTTNSCAAYGVIGLFLCLFSPIADPARLAVADQMARLRAGAMAADKLDLIFLQFESGRFGRDAIASLSNDPRFSAGIARVRQFTNKYTARVLNEPTRVMVYPQGAALPADFPPIDSLEEVRECRIGCDAYLVNLDADTDNEVIFSRFDGGVVFDRDTHGAWRAIGTIDRLCAGDLTALRQGRYVLETPRAPMLSINGSYFPVRPNIACRRMD